MGVFSENAIIGASAAGGYDIDQSLRFNDDDSAKLERTPSSSGSLTTWTFSAWVKRGNLGNTQHILGSYVSGTYIGEVVWHASDNQFQWEEYNGNTIGKLRTEKRFRDPSAWYHIVCRWDTTNSTAGDRMRMWINGVEETSFAIDTNPSSGAFSTMNTANATALGVRPDGTGYLDGYLAEAHFIDGTALDASYFGETNADTNQWVPIKYTGSYGTNGFYLDFSNSSSLGADASGNGNNFTSTNLASTDQVKDSPTNNFCTFNPLGISTYNKWNTASEGNLKLYGTGDNFGESTFHLSSGKWYFEVDLINSYGKDGTYITLAGLNDTYLSGSFDVRLLNGLGTGDNPGLYGVAVDMDTGSWSTTRNGSAFGSGSFTPQDCKIGICNGNGAFAEEIVLNFGQDSSFAGNRTAQGNTDSNDRGDFFYTPATGYLALCTANLDDPSIADPTAHFNTVTYSGNSSTQAITGVGHQPDFTWFKARHNSYDYSLVDSVRGVNKAMASNTTSAESGFGTNYTIDSFDSDGFTLHNATYNNASGSDYVAWNWKAGGTASSNSDGSITSSVSANTDAGFSIVSWTGTGSNVTVGHGLSQAPELIINKSRGDSYNWAMQSFLWNSASDTNLLYLNTTAGTSDDTNVFQAAPTATVFSPQGGSWAGIGTNTIQYIAYCFHSVDGYSKVGKYSGNGAQDGSFVLTGFRPAFIFIKRITSAGSNSYIVDNKRIGYNYFVYATDVGSNKYLWPDSTAAEGNGNTTKGIGMDILSNGFKFRTSGGDYNASSNDYLFYAIAESPFKTANAR